VGHLILEVVAYADEEAETNHGGRCRITLHADGSVTVSDHGNDGPVPPGRGRSRDGRRERRRAAALDDIAALVRRGRRPAL